MELRIVKGFVVLILFSFLYIFFSDTLHIHCGFCCWTIHSVEYSRQGVLPSSPLFCVRACMCGWKRAREMSPFRAHMLCCFSSLFFFFFSLSPDREMGGGYEIICMLAIAAVQL